MDLVFLFFLLSTNCESVTLQASVRVILYCCKPQSFCSCFNHKEDWQLTQNNTVNVTYFKLLCITLLTCHSFLFVPYSFPYLFFTQPEHIHTDPHKLSISISPLPSVSPYPPTPHLHLTASLPSYYSPLSPLFFCQRHTSCPSLIRPSKAAASTACLWF